MFALSECFVVFRVGGFVFPSGSQMFSEFGKPVWKEDIPITNVYYCFATLQISLMSCYLILIFVTTPTAPPGGAFEYKMSSNFAPE